jgi:hypothetical protein
MRMTGEQIEVHRGRIGIMVVIVHFLEVRERRGNICQKREYQLSQTDQLLTLVSSVEKPAR